MAVIRTLLAVLLCAAPSFAKDVEAIVDGPTEAFAGDLVVLISVRSKGDTSKWIVPAELEGFTIESRSERSIAFSRRIAGTYTFHLIVVGVDDDDDTKQIVIKTTPHSVELKGGICDTPPPSEDPDKPEEPVDPPPANDELVEISRKAAASLRDPETATALAKALEAVVAANHTSVEAIRNATQLSVENVLLKREGGSRDKDWLGAWRKPVGEEIDATSPASYNASLAALAKGLRLAAGSVQEPPPAAPEPERVIRMETRDDCGWCIQWKREVQPIVEQMGFKVVYVETSGVAPVFHVRVGDKSKTFTGYRNASSFREFVSGLVAFINREV